MINAGRAFAATPMGATAATNSTTESGFTYTGCYFACVSVGTNMKGKITSVGLGYGPRVGGEVDLGQLTSSGIPGWSLNGAASFAVGAGMYGTAGGSTYVDGTLGPQYGYGEDFGLGVGVSANLTWTFG